MLILLEGPDCGGKTTLADQLAAHFRAASPYPTRLEVLHAGPPAPGVSPFDEYELALDEPDRLARILDVDGLVVLDRWHAGEAVYGPLLRGRSRLTDAGLYHVELALDALGAVKVACLPPLTVLHERLRRRGDPVIGPGHLPTLHAFYSRLAVEHGYALSTVPADLLGFARDRTYLRRVLRGHDQGTYLGSLTPRALLVGDVRNPNGPAQYRRAFTPLHRGGSPTWLLDALLASGYHREVGVVNAHEPNVDHPALWRRLRQPRLVALGQRAHAHLRSLGLTPAATVYHPQFSKRFQNSKFESYVDALREAINPHGDHPARRLDGVPDPGQGAFDPGGAGAAPEPAHP